MFAEVYATRSNEEPVSRVSGSEHRPFWRHWSHVPTSNEIYSSLCFFSSASGLIGCCHSFRLISVGSLPGVMGLVHGQVWRKGGFSWSSSVVQWKYPRLRGRKPTFVFHQPTVGTTLCYPKMFTITLGRWTIYRFFLNSEFDKTVYIWFKLFLRKWIMN